MTDDINTPEEQLRFRAADIDWEAIEHLILN